MPIFLVDRTDAFASFGAPNRGTPNCGASQLDIMTEGGALQTMAIFVALILGSFILTGCKTVAESTRPVVSEPRCAANAFAAYEQKDFVCAEKLLYEIPNAASRHELMFWMLLEVGDLEGALSELKQALRVLRSAPRVSVQHRRQHEALRRLQQHLRTVYTELEPLKGTGIMSPGMPASGARSLQPPEEVWGDSANVSSAPTPPPRDSTQFIDRGRNQ